MSTVGVVPGMRRLAREELPVTLAVSLHAADDGLRSQLVEDDEIAPFVNVYVEGEDVRTRQGIDTEVRPGSTVILLPAMAGG